MTTFLIFASCFTAIGTFLLGTTTVGYLVALLLFVLAFFYERIKHIDQNIERIANKICGNQNRDKFINNKGL